MSYFKSPYNEFVYLRTYAKWLEGKGRREKWPETVARYMDFMRENLGEKLTEAEYSELSDAILRQEVVPSMRLMQFAGEAARRTNVCAYNCSFIAPSRLRDLSDIVFILMCGTGVGFSVEKETIEKLPVIMQQVAVEPVTYIVDDSKEGWANAFRFGLETWYSGADVTFDFSKIRAAGSRLKTFGGFASGPAPLKDLLAFSREKILKNQGKKLSPIEVHDIICKIADIVVCGGVRRSALISLSDLDDHDMRDSKHGQFWMIEPQRSLANNSAVYAQKPSAEEFLSEFHALIKSKSGERGIFNRGDLLKTLPERRLKKWVERGVIENGQLTGIVGTNPCAEIILTATSKIGGQMCNLSEVICRPDDTEETLLRKIRLATILGTYQSTLTKFGYLPSEWEENCKDERLLGVSLTGQMDCPAVRNGNVLTSLKEAAIATNLEFAGRFGINQSTCITCVKPSGNVSQTFGCSSGLHGAYAPFYIRRVRITCNDPLLKMAIDQGVPAFPEVGQNPETATTFVLEFPQRAPTGAILQRDFDAIAQLEYWKKVKTCYTEHNPSVTVYVKDDEWIQVANWVYQNWEIVGGLSFLPASDHVYALAPYQEITEEEYERRMQQTAALDLSKLWEYEQQDTTTQKAEWACAGGSCEI